MRKKLITLGLVSTLLVGCGSTKPTLVPTDGCCESPKVTQNDRVTLGVLFSVWYCLYYIQLPDNLTNFNINNLVNPNINSYIRVL